MNAPGTAAFELEMTRFIRAPRERVFDAFVQREALAAWMCPRGIKAAEVEVDPRVGGRYRLTMQTRHGERFIVGGVYRELHRPERIVYTWRWESGPAPDVETLVTVTFEARGGGTALRMLHTGFPDAALRESHARGWSSTFNKLNDLLDPDGTAGTVTVVGAEQSSYVWSARLGLAEKGVAHRVDPVSPHSPESLAVHPFGRIPALRDGEIVLFETTAILRYVEESFDGPSLLPGTILDRARCEQWVSAINSYFYDPMIRRFVLQYLFPRGADDAPDRAVIEGALREMPPLLAALDRAYGPRDVLAGTAVSIADLLVAPILFYVASMPEGPALLETAPNVRRAQAAFRARPSFRLTQPQGPAQPSGRAA